MTSLVLFKNPAMSCLGTTPGDGMMQQIKPSVCKALSVQSSGSTCVQIRVYYEEYLGMSSVSY